MQKELPKEFLRGITNKDFVKNGHVMQTAFQFDEATREDNMKEASINWLDDEGAITVALNQRKENGKLQFVAGIARLDLSRVKLILASLPEGLFSYERAPIPDNKYHGNLLVSNNADKQMRLLISNGLALAAGSNIIEQVSARTI